MVGVRIKYVVYSTECVSKRIINVWLRKICILVFESKIIIV